MTGSFLTRIANTWTFMWKCLGVIRRYRPLVLLPIVSLVCCVLVTTVVLAVGTIVFDDISIRMITVAPSHPQISTADMPQLVNAAMGCVVGLIDNQHCPLYREDEQTAEPKTEAERSRAGHVRLLLFLFYVANYTVIVYFNVAFAHIALSRLTGGKANLTDGLALARSRIFAIIQWAILASIVGMVLKSVRDRSGPGQWIASFLGYAWNLATYFVMPLLALEDISPGEALYRSADLFREKWGEIITAQFSFSLLFYVFASPALAFFFFAGLLGQTFGFVAIAAMAYLWFLSLIIFSTEQVFIAALYLYAAEGKIAKGFSKSDFLTAWGLSRLADVGV